MVLTGSSSLEPGNTTILSTTNKITTQGIFPEISRLGTVAG